MVKLSICVVTMNRAAQLQEALESCLRCNLDESTEFIVVDNASTDDTETVVRELFKNSRYNLIYYKNKINVGAGAGRNKYFELANGKYVYGMDDDAVIDFNKNPNFFKDAVKIMDENKDIITLATQIYDEAWGKYRLNINKHVISKGVYKCKMFCGGSHFLKKEFFENSPYLPNKYGYEEMPPSLIVCDNNKLNVFCSDLLVIHKPKVNKWNYKDEKNYDLLITECAVPYAIKKMMYPNIFRPLLYVMHLVRCIKYLPVEKKLWKKLIQIVEETDNLYNIDYKLKVSTICKLFKDFGFSIF